MPNRVIVSYRYYAHNKITANYPRVPRKSIFLLECFFLGLITLVFFVHSIKKPLFGLGFSYLDLPSLRVLRVQSSTIKSHAVEVLEHTQTFSHMINIEIAQIVVLNERISKLQKLSKSVDCALSY